MWFVSKTYSRMPLHSCCDINSLFSINNCSHSPLSFDNNKKKNTKIRSHLIIMIRSQDFRNKFPWHVSLSVRPARLFAAIRTELAFAQTWSSVAAASAVLSTLATLTIWETFSVSWFAVLSTNNLYFALLIFIYNSWS